MIKALSSRIGRAPLSVLGSAIFALAVALATVCVEATWGQTRTIKMIVPYAPGDGPDFLARLLADHIGRTQGSTVVVENRPGAGTVIGTEAVARALPDGNTLLINTTAFVTSPHLRKLNYDPVTSFEPICYLVSTPAVIADRPTARLPT